MKYDKTLIYELEEKEIKIINGNNSYTGKVKSIHRNPVSEEIVLKLDNKKIIFGEPHKIGKLNNLDYVFIYKGQNEVFEDNEFFDNLSISNNKGLSVEDVLSNMENFKDHYIFIHCL